MFGLQERKGASVGGVHVEALGAITLDTRSRGVAGVGRVLQGMGERKHDGVGKAQEKGQKNEHGGGLDAHVQLLANGSGIAGSADLLQTSDHAAHAFEPDVGEANDDDDEHGNLREKIDRGSGYGALRQLSCLRSEARKIGGVIRHKCSRCFAPVNGSLNVLGGGCKAATQPRNAANDYCSNSYACAHDCFGNRKPAHSVEDSEESHAETEELDRIKHPVPAVL